MKTVDIFMMNILEQVSVHKLSRKGHFNVLVERKFREICLVHVSVPDWTICQNWLIATNIRQKLAFTLLQFCVNNIDRVWTEYWVVVGIDNSRRKSDSGGGGSCCWVGVCMLLCQ